MGAGAGAAAGLLTELFSTDVSLRDAFRNMLVGGGAGAAIGAGAGALMPQTQAPVAAPESAPRKTMDPFAAGTSMLPIIGPAYQGYQAGGLEQAARVGGRSAAEGIGGAFAAKLAPKLLRRPLPPSLAMALPLAAMAHGAYAAADNFNKSAMHTKYALSLPQSLHELEIPKSVSRFTINPYAESGGATIGGLGGAALGGLGGLAKTIFDKENDGALSTLKKALQGAAIGGGIGAAAGAGTSYLARQNMLDALPDSIAKRPGVDNPTIDQKLAMDRRRDAQNETLKRFALPVVPTIDRLRGNLDQQAYNKDVMRTNVNESLMSLLAPLLVSQVNK